MTTHRENRMTTTPRRPQGVGLCPLDAFQFLTGWHTASDCASAETSGLRKGEAGG